MAESAADGLDHRIDLSLGAATTAAAATEIRQPGLIRQLVSTTREYARDAYDCAWLIAQSPYLVALCSYMMLQCCTAAMLVRKLFARNSIP